MKVSFTQNVIETIKMEKRLFKTRKIILVLFLFSGVLFSCKKQVAKNNLDTAIELTESNPAIIDSIANLEKRGVKFLVCFFEEKPKHTLLSFNIVQPPGQQIHPYKIAANFKIRTIKGVDILFRDFTHSAISEQMKKDKKVRELITKRFISLEKPTGYNDCDYVKFVFCNKDFDNFKSFNSQMLTREELLFLDSKKPGAFNRELFYPKCD